MHCGHLLSLAYLTVQGCPPLEHVEVAAANGYDAVGLRLVAPYGLDLAHPIVGRPALVRDIRRRADDLGVSFLDGEVFTLRPGVDAASWRPVLETAAEFGMRFMQITSEDPEPKRAAADLARIGEMAGGYGIDIAVEFMRWRAAATIEEAAWLVEGAGSPHVGVLLDALHLSRSGGDPAAVAALPAGVVRYLQLCDAAATRPSDDAGLIAEARAGRSMPGTGALWLRELMAVLPADIAISVETPHAGDRDLTFDEKARRGMEATRVFLDGL